MGSDPERGKTTILGLIDQGSLTHQVRHYILMAICGSDPERGKTTILGLIDQGSLPHQVLDRL